MALATPPVLAAEGDPEPAAAAASVPLQPKEQKLPAVEVVGRRQSG